MNTKKLRNKAKSEFEKLYINGCLTLEQAENEGAFIDALVLDYLKELKENREKKEGEKCHNTIT